MKWNWIPQHHLRVMNELLGELKSYDLATFEHCVRVSQWCRFLAEAAGVTQYEQLQAHVAGLLHDIGKMKIPIEVLKKPGKLTDKEYLMVKRHSMYSAEVLEPLEDEEFFREIQLAILHHHERVDGKGYPFQLEGESIPYTSRIVLVVDAFDAMTQDRAYRKGLPLNVVYKELEKFSGTQFDAELVKIFIEGHKKLLLKTNSAAVLPFPSIVAAA